MPADADGCLGPANSSLPVSVTGTADDWPQCCDVGSDGINQSRNSAWKSSGRSIDGRWAVSGQSSAVRRGSRQICAVPRRGSRRDRGRQAGPTWAPGYLQVARVRVGRVRSPGCRPSRPSPRRPAAASAMSDPPGALSSSEATISGRVSATSTATPAPKEAPTR